MILPKIESKEQAIYLTAGWLKYWEDVRHEMTVATIRGMQKHFDNVYNTMFADYKTEDTPPEPQ